MEEVKIFDPRLGMKGSKSLGSKVSSNWDEEGFKVFGMKKGSKTIFDEMA